MVGWGGVNKEDNGLGPKDLAMIWKDLWSADMSFVMKKFFLDDKECEDKYGHLPKMAMESKGMMGSGMPSSFARALTHVPMLSAPKTILSYLTMRLTRSSLSA